MQISASGFDRAVERVLRVERALPTDNADLKAAERGAENSFMLSMFWAGVRCILEYVVLPFTLPLLGLTGRFGAPIVLVLNLVALATLVSSVRKFYAVDYRNKRAYLFVALVAGVIISVFIVQSLVTLFGA